MLRKWMSCAKRGHLADNGEVLIRGMIYSKTFTATAQTQNGMFRLTTRAILPYLLPACILLVAGTLFVYSGLAAWNSGSSSQTPDRFVLSFFLSLILLLTGFLLYVSCFDTVLVDIQTLRGRLDIRRVFKQHSIDFELTDLSIVPTELYRTKFREIRGNTRSNTFKDSELLSIDTGEDVVYFLLWASPEGEEPRLEWLDWLRGVVPQQSAEYAGIDYARVVAEFGRGAY